MCTFLAILRRVSQGRGSRQAEPQKRFAKVWCLSVRLPRYSPRGTDGIPMPTTPCVITPPLPGVLFSLRDTDTTSTSLPALGRRLKKKSCVLVDLPRKEVTAVLWAPALGPQCLLSLESSSESLAWDRAGQSGGAEGFQRGARLCLDGIDGEGKAGDLEATRRLPEP